MHSMDYIKLTVLVLLNSFAVGQVAVIPPFFDTPPSNYTERLTLRDCTKRYYSSDDSNRPLQGVGGVRVFRGEFQHMVAIGWTRSKGSINYLCGGSLISRDFVLTAAHCAADSDKYRMFVIAKRKQNNNPPIHIYSIPPDTVRLGDTDLGSSEDDEFAQQIQIARFIKHPQYRGSRSYFDIALVELQRPADFTEAVCNACLWREHDVPKERMDAIGFGATGFGEALSPTLQRVELDWINLSDCAERITVSRRQMPDGFRKDQFCAAGNGMDTCEGDSGGPIGVKRVDVGGAEIPLVVGVVSFGTPCTAGSTGVYSKVSEFMDWIEQTSNKTFDYIECTRSSYCPGRPRTYISVQFENNYAMNRFGLLWDETDTSSLYECAATLIDERYLLTLASCVTSNRGHPKYVAYSNKERVRVTDVYVSPRYRAGSPENNVALLKVSKYVNTDVFQPACLWNRNIDGEWGSDLEFSAFGPVENYESGAKLKNSTISVKGKQGLCGSTNADDVVCYANSVNLVPNVCMMDHGGPVKKESFWEKSMFVYGLVSTLSKDCGSNLYVNDVTPHIEWMESIMIAMRDQFLVFSD